MVGTINRCSLRKKGFLFTILSIVLLTLMYVLFSGRIALEQSIYNPFLSGETSATSVLLGQISSSYIDDLLAGTSKLVVDNIALELNESGGGIFAPYLTAGFFSSEYEFNQLFTEALINGTVNGVLWDRMEGRSLNDSLGLLASQTFESGGLQVNYIFLPESVWLMQTGPWNLTARATIVLDIKGSSLNVENRYVFGQGRFSIQGMHDPYILVMSDGALDGSITIDERNSWNLAALQAQVALDTPHYMQYNGSPSYLQRFYKDFSLDYPASYGMERFISPHHDLPLLDAAGIISLDAEGMLSDVPSIDYLVFGSVICDVSGPLTYTYNRTGLDYRFVLDQRRMEYYTGSAQTPPPLTGSEYTQMCP